MSVDATVKERMTVRQDVCKVRRSSSFRLTERQTGGHTLSCKCEVWQECVRGRERKANKVRRMKMESTNLSPTIKSFLNTSKGLKKGGTVITCQQSHKLNHHLPMFK